MQRRHLYGVLPKRFHHRIDFACDQNEVSGDRRLGRGAAAHFGWIQMNGGSTLRFLQNQPRFTHAR